MVQRHALTLLRETDSTSLWYNHRYGPSHHTVHTTKHNKESYTQTHRNHVDSHDELSTEDFGPCCCIMCRHKPSKLSFTLSYAVLWSTPFNN